MYPACGSPTSSGRMETTFCRTGSRRNFTCVGLTETIAQALEAGEPGELLTAGDRVLRAQRFGEAQPELGMVRRAGFLVDEIVEEELHRDAIGDGHRVIIAEDTPGSRVDRALNSAWDWLLNIRHGVPTPFTIEVVDGLYKAIGEALEPTVAPDEPENRMHGCRG